MLPQASLPRFCEACLYRHDGSFSDPNDAARSPFATK